MAKGTKTGGRRKGTPNKATAAKVAEIASTGETPLDFLLRAMRDPEKDFNVRLEAAKSAAQYVHPRLAAVAHSGDLTHRHVTEYSDDELAAYLEEGGSAGTAETSTRTQ